MAAAGQQAKAEAAPVARPRRAKAVPVPRSGRGWAVLLMLLPVILVLLPSCLVLSVAMMPTLIALLVERRSERYSAIAVGALNFCGALYFLIALWQLQHDVPTALHVLQDVYGWLAAYGGATAGWTIYLVMPAAMGKFAELQTELRLGQLRRLQKELVEQWGEGVAGDKRPG